MLPLLRRKPESHRPSDAGRHAHRPDVGSWEVPLPPSQRPRIQQRATLLLLLAVAFSLARCTPVSKVQAPAAPPAEACTFVNPVAESGQDPWVVRWKGWYYFVASEENALYVYKSERLTDLKKNRVRVWTPPDSGWNQAHLWAPELHFIEGRWYIYYAAGRAGPPFVHQRSGVLQSVGSDPQGAYVDKGPLYTGDDLASRTENKWAIDVTVAQLNGQRYAVWSGWEENQPDDDTPQHLYIATMSNPWTISSDRVKISSPTQPWEQGTELDLNEGPQFLTHDGEVFIVYSARESWLPAYQMGQLRLQPSTGDRADPMDPQSWIKSGPVFTGTADVHGVGHASFTTSPDSTEHWIVYHTKKETTPGWDRMISAQKFEWDRDGAPRFGTPAPSGERLRVPAGQGPCE